MEERQGPPHLKSGRTPWFTFSGGQDQFVRKWEKVRKEPELLDFFEKTKYTGKLTPKNL